MEHWRLGLKENEGYSPPPVNQETLDLLIQKLIRSNLKLLSQDLGPANPGCGKVMDFDFTSLDTFKLAPQNE